MMKYSFIGSKERVQRSLRDFIDDTKANEVMIASHVYDVEKKKRVYELVKSA
jgi:alkanesulfonate monooxygenase SsuD/methylene tetrahydromethanopterin reductase-like flavin-dependent oxidoreductase (luciferase family)